MDIYSDSVEASKNRRTAAIEEMTQEFNILGADGDDILVKWNNLITYLETKAIEYANETNVTAVSVEDLIKSLKK